MWRASDEQELGPSRDHVGSHVGSAHDLESRCALGLATLRAPHRLERRYPTTSPWASNFSPAAVAAGHRRSRRFLRWSSRRSPRNGGNSSPTDFHADQGLPEAARPLTALAGVSSA